MLKETQSICADLLCATIISNTFPSAPGSGMTIAAFSTKGYVRSGADLVYCDQPAQAITLSGSAGTYYVALAEDTWTSIASWSRVPGSHYVWQGPVGSQPANPDGGLVFLSCTVTGTNISSITPIANAKAPILAQQNANAVAITDGRISIGGHAPTGVLDVQSSVQASDGANTYYGPRVWPVAPSGAVTLQPVRVEAATGAGLATAAFYGLVVANQPGTLANVAALDTGISAGANRWNLRISGTAQNSFAGNVGIGNPTPSYPLDVTGDVRVSNLLGVGGAPTGTDFLTLRHARVGGLNALAIRATGADAGGYALTFHNVTDTQVGSITYSATATAYNTSSDARLKHAVQALTGALDAVKALRPVKYKWNSTDEPDIGFLAHELMTVAPHAVTGLPDELHPDGTIKPQQVDHSKLIPLLTAALKEVLARLETLEEALGL